MFVASGVVAVGFASGTFAQPSKSDPDFSSASFGWVSLRGGVVAMPGSPDPVGQDPRRPLVANNTGQQPTFPYADLNNPNLTAFARDGLKKANDLSDSGFAMYSRASRCWATGVPVALNSVVQPIFFIQTPREVTTISQGDQVVRHIYMTCPIRRIRNHPGTENRSDIMRASGWWSKPSLKTRGPLSTISARPTATNFMSWSAIT
jgi:hypothetical protein